MSSAACWACWRRREQEQIADLALVVVGPVPVHRVVVLEELRQEVVHVPVVLVNLLHGERQIRRKTNITCAHDAYLTLRLGVQVEVEDIVRAELPIADDNPTLRCRLELQLDLRIVDVEATLPEDLEPFLVEVAAEAQLVRDRPVRAWKTRVRLAPEDDAKGPEDVGHAGLQHETTYSIC